MILSVFVLFRPPQTAFASEKNVAVLIDQSKSKCRLRMGCHVGLTAGNLPVKMFNIRYLAVYVIKEKILH